MITVFDSPQPTRNMHLMTRASRRKMAENMRVRRRGGRRRHMWHRRNVTRIFDPASQYDCAFACVLKAAGKACTKSNIEDLRVKTADRVYTAYVHDQTYHGYKVRDMIEETGHTLAAYLAMLRWRLWASPIEVCVAAEVLYMHIAVSSGQGVMIHGDRPSFLVRLSKKHYTLHVMRKVPKMKLHAVQERGGMHTTGAWTWEHATPNTASILSLPPAATVPEVREEMPDWAIPSYALPGLLPQEKEARLVKIEISPVLRTDVATLQMMVRASLLPQGLRQRLAEILLVPEA